MAELLRLHEGMAAGNSHVRDLRSMVKSSYECTWTRAEGQQDSADFLGALIHTLMDEAGDGGYELTHVLSLRKAQKDRCVHCKLVEVERPKENWNITMVPIQSTTLEGCFQSVLTGASYTRECPCSNSPTTFVQDISIDEHPVCMVVQLMRFEKNGANPRKIMQPVQVPLVWTPTDDSPTYHLRAATLHHGISPKGGHYTTLRLTPDGQAILVDDNECTRITSQAEIQDSLSTEAYLLYYDIEEQGASPSMKRMKAGHEAAPAPQPAVEGVKRNILSAAGDSLPKHQPAQGPPQAGTASSASTVQPLLAGAGAPPPIAAKDKFIQDLVNGNKHTQFKKMDQKSCEEYLGLLKVTPLAGGGEKGVRNQLHSCLTEEILAKVGRDLDKCNKILHHLGIPKLKVLPAAAAAATVSNDDTDTSPESDVASASAVNTSAQQPTANKDSTQEDLHQAPTQVNANSDELQAIIGPIKVLLAKENNNETLTAAERAQRSTLITRLVLNCPNVAVLKKFLLDQQGAEGNNKAPKPQNSINRLKDDIHKYVSGNSRALHTLMDIIVQHRELMEALDHLLAKATTSDLVRFLEAIDIKITNRATKRIKDLARKEVRKRPSTIEQLRAIVDCHIGSSGGGGSLTSPAVSTDTIGNDVLAQNVLDFDKLDANTTKQLALQLKCKKNQLKKKLLKRLVDQTSTARLKQLLHRSGFSPAKRIEEMKRQTVKIGLKNPSMLQKIVDASFGDHFHQQMASSSASASGQSFAQGSAGDSSMGEGGRTTSSSDSSSATLQNADYGLTIGQACRVLTEQPLASRTVEELEQLAQTIFQEAAAAAAPSQQATISTPAYHAMLCKRVNNGLAQIVVNNLSTDHKTYLLRLFKKKCVRNPEDMTKRLFTLVKSNRYALKRAVDLVSGGGIEEDDDDNVVPGLLGHDYHPDDLEDIQASQEVMEYIRLARMEGLRSNQFNMIPPSWPDSNPILLAGQQWSTTMTSLQLRTCSECLEKWIHPISPCAQKCPTCANDRSHPSTFSPANGMFPGVQPPALRALTLVEQLCIAQICPMMSVVLHPNQSTTLQGQVVSFYQGGVHQTAEVTVLPRRPDNLGLCLIRQQGSTRVHQLTASRQRIREALLWLKANNRFYANVTISEEALQLYPEAGGVVNDLMQLDHSVDDGHQLEASTGVLDPQAQAESYQSSMTMSNMDLPNMEQQLQEAVRASTGHASGSDASQANSPDTSQMGWRHQLDRESEEGFFTRCFPHLFPTGAGDITLPRLGRSPRNLLDWAAHLTRLELVEHEPNPFASDMRFVHTVTNIHLRCV